MNNFKHRVLRIEPNNTAYKSVLVGVPNLHLNKKSYKGFSPHRVYCLLLYKGVLVRVLNLHRDKKSLMRTGATWKIS